MRAILIPAIVLCLSVPVMSQERDELPPLLPDLVTLKAHQSIERGLKFLASAQARDGSFRSNGNFGTYPTTMTALAGLALLSSGSTTTRGPYAPNIRKAVDYMLAGARAEPIQTIILVPLQLGAIGMMATNLLAGGPASGARYVAAVLMGLAVGGVLFVNATFNSGERPDA